MRFYIDPGTGSMLFTILVGLLGAGIYALRGMFMKLRFLLTGGSKEKASDKTIPYVIFTDDKRYWNMFGPICREFDRRGVSVVYMTPSSDDPALKEEFQHVKCRFIGEGNKAFAKMNLLNADVVLATTPGLDVYQWKRSKDVKCYVHILHAVNDAMYRMFGLDYFDSVLLSGPYQEDQIREVGQPYMDALYERIRSAPPLENHKTTILLAPTWGKSGILSRYGSKAIQALLDTGYHIVVRPHPQSFTSEKELLEKLQTEFPDSERLEWNHDNDNFEVLRRSDLMISDFSGVIFDFALAFDKPILYADTSYDKSPYDSCWLDEEMWTFTVLPKIGRQLTEEDLPHIKEVIDSCLEDEKYQRGRDEARAEAWNYIGESTVRTVDYLIEKRERLCKTAEN